MSSPSVYTTTWMPEDSPNAKNPGEATNTSLPSSESAPRYNAVPSPDYPEDASTSFSLPTNSQQAGTIPRPAVYCNSDNVVMTTNPVDLPATYLQHEGDKQSYSTCSGETAATTTQSMNPPLTYPQPAGNKPPLSTSRSGNMVTNTQSMNPPHPYPEYAGSNLSQGVYYQGRGVVVTTQPAMTTMTSTHRQSYKPDYLLQSIVNLLICCLLLGIAALVFSIKLKYIPGLQFSKFGLPIAPASTGLDWINNKVSQAGVIALMIFTEMPCHRICVTLVGYCS
ncbi:uncharacterized protein LOC144769660 [Lissotriton helveticus]